MIVEESSRPSRSRQPYHNQASTEKLVTKPSGDSPKRVVFQAQETEESQDTVDYGGLGPEDDYLEAINSYFVPATSHSRQDDMDIQSVTAYHCTPVLEVEQPHAKITTTTVTTVATTATAVATPATA
jgi:hypothetical protein